jgi:hypothetical protein
MSDPSFILLYTVKEFVVVGVRFTWNFGCMEFMFFFFNYYYYKAAKGMPFLPQKY